MFVSDYFLTVIIIQLSRVKKKKRSYRSIPRAMINDDLIRTTFGVSFLSIFLMLERVCRTSQGMREEKNLKRKKLGSLYRQLMLFPTIARGEKCYSQTPTSIILKFIRSCNLLFFAKSYQGSTSIGRENEDIIVVFVSYPQK